MNPTPTWVDRVRAALREDGRQSVRQLATALRGDLPYASARKCVHCALVELRGKRQAYIAEYVRRQEPGMKRSYSVALFALGPWKDAKPISAMTGAERNKAYREKQKRFVNSVFQMAAPFARGRQRRIGHGFRVPESL